MKIAKSCSYDDYLIEIIYFTDTPTKYAYPVLKFYNAFDNFIYGKNKLVEILNLKEEDFKKTDVVTLKTFMGGSKAVEFSVLKYEFIVVNKHYDFVINFINDPSYRRVLKTDLNENYELDPSILINNYKLKIEALEEKIESLEKSKNIYKKNYFDSLKIINSLKSKKNNYIKKDDDPITEMKKAEEIKNISKEIEENYLKKLSTEN